MDFQVTVFAQAEAARGVWPFLKENGLLLAPPVLSFVALGVLLPRARRSAPLWGVLLAVFALILGAAVLVRTETVFVETLLFYAFAGLALGAGGMMIAQRNPVHAALSFALVVLSTCGLFLLQAAPFLMAATIIVYAGAIVVTFLFVIMLAHQGGASSADQSTREPVLASVAGCVLLASLVILLHRTYDTTPLDQLGAELKKVGDARDEAEVIKLLGDPKQTEFGKFTRPIVEKLREQFSAEGQDEIREEIEAFQKAWNFMNVPRITQKARLLHEAVLAKRQQQGSLALNEVPGKSKTPGHSAPGKLPAQNVAALGRTVFTDYLVPVLLAAVLLLVATIGAIVIAGRRSEELR
ncbi:MAG: NADH-quinone oxidoreductase subunit J [Planctomycetes bacterium]|nr:NADH-quinone oxidoreductase subunit J [Planctomycetota bacterium]